MTRVDIIAAGISFLVKMYQKELQLLGLSEKEVKVYLASLGLGPSSILAISKKAGLKRPTTHYTVEELIEKGLMSSFERGKKRYFIAESPERIQSLISVQKRKAEALEESFQKILPALNEVFRGVGEKPRVRFFEGKEGIKTIQEEIIKTKCKSIEELVPVDPAQKLFPPHAGDHRERSLKSHQNIPIRIIYTSAKGAILPSKKKSSEARFVPAKRFPFSAEIVVFGKKIAFASMEGRVFGAIIESEKITETLRSFFNLAWEEAGKYQK